jgi:hypothetical protein
MEIVEQIRTRFHQQLLRKELPTRQAHRSSAFLENAASVGLLFEATVLEDRNTVLRFAEQLKSKGKKVKLLGYFNEKLKSGDFPFDHFDKKQLDWALRPKSETITNFANQTFDLLINVSPKTVLPLDYIAACSKARFRVGPFTENTFCYDLMIDQDEKKGLEEFLRQVQFYLGKMQPALDTVVA